MTSRTGHHRPRHTRRRRRPHGVSGTCAYSTRRALCAGLKALEFLERSRDLAAEPIITSARPREPGPETEAGKS